MSLILCVFRCNCHVFVCFFFGCVVAPYEFYYKAILTGHSDKVLQFLVTGIAAT